jgi:hypothetical protein
MAQDRPTARELLEAVREFLDREVRPRLDGQPAFHTRVAANVLAIVERELEMAPGFDAAEAERLRDMLGRDGALEDLNAALATAIRAGGMDGRSDVAAHLLATARDKLRIANPRYLGKDGT